MIGLFLAIIIGAGILGIIEIIAVMEEGEFPGWGKMVLCVLAAAIPALIVNFFVPPLLHIIGFAVEAVCAVFAIAATCSMTLQRASIAAGIYLGIQTAISLVFYFMTRTTS
jgi:hypothetical protein